MKKLIYFIWLLFFSLHIYANDSVVTNGAESVSIDYSEKDIAIEKEDLDIYLYKDYYRVTVAYEYYNKGSKKTVLLGFPIHYVSTAGIQEKDKFISKYDFKQSFNGKKINIKDTYDSPERKNEPYTIAGVYWIKREVTFEKGTNFSNIEYIAPYSRVGFETRFDYILSSAACWNNVIKVLNVHIHNDNEVLINKNGWKIGSYSNKNCPTNFRIFENVFRFSFENIDPNNFREINLIIDRYDLSDNWIPFNDFANGWCYNLYHVYRDKNEIWLFTEAQLQLFINCFYASRGYVLKNPKLADYFKDKYFHFLYTTYTPDKDFSEEKFNKTEKENIRFLINMKKKLYK